MSLCPASPESAGFIGSVVHFVDCKSDALGSGAYQALAAPSSSLSLVLTGFLIIFIALIGYRLLLGASFSVRSATLAAIKIGAVFALATSWGAYQTLVYNVVTDGPAEIAGDIARPAALPGADGTLVQRLDASDGALSELAILGAGIPPAVAHDQVVPSPFGGFNQFALGGSRILFLIGAIAGIAGVHAIAALMLALGPFFIAFLLFDNTRSLFEGWVRVLAGAALSAIGVTVALGLELSLMEPWLSSVLARRVGGQALPEVPTELFVVTSLFALVILAAILASARLAAAFRLAPLLEARGEARVAAPAERQGFGTAVMTRQGDERSRADAVADVLVSLQQRERSAALLAGIGRSAVGPGAGALPDSHFSMRPGASVGRAFPRRARSRVSASAALRDKR